MTILRDPIWQFVGAALSMVAVSITLYLFFLQRNKKSLLYEIPELIPLLNVGAEIKEKVQILFDGTPVTNVYLVIVRFSNNGNIPIEVIDFVEPLTVFFRKGTTVLSVEVFETSPSSLKLEMEMRKDRIIILPTLLNASDSFALKVLATHPDKKPFPAPDARIVGVSDISMPNPNTLWKSAGIGGVLVVTGLAWGLLTLSNIASEPESYEMMLAMVPTILLIITGLIVMYLPIGRDINQRHKQARYYMGSDLYEEFFQLFRG